MDQPLEEQLRATLNMIPAYAWYATPSGGLIFVNERNADYGGLPSDHPLRHGTDTSPAWDSHIPFLHPEDQEGTRRVWSVPPPSLASPQTRTSIVQWTVWPTCCGGPAWYR